MTRALGILSVLLGLGLAVALTLLFLRENPGVRAGAPPVVEATDPRLLAALERIEAALARLEGRTVRPAPGALGSDPADAAVAAVADDGRFELSATPEELIRIELLVQEMHDVLDEHVVAARAWRERNQSLGELKASEDGPDWKALDDLMDQWHRDESEAKQAVKLLAFRDVLTRYGTPTEIWSNEGGAHWVYQRGVDEVYFRFNDGFVTVLGVK